MLETLDLTKELSKEECKERLPALQIRLHQLQRACWKAEIATVVVFEGWDAAGKGTVIRKLTQRLEPRGFSLHAIRESRTLSSQLPWMWRFWVRLPNWGEMAIFDHSWYGRVLVERVQGLVAKERWRRAYADILSFERALVDDRYVIAKYFLHISKEEQKKRFKALEEDSRTAWQVEKKDWAQHEHYDEYRLAAEEMLERTESEWAPWTLVEATDKRWVRMKVLGTLIESMEDALERRDIEVPEPMEPDTNSNGDD